MKKITEKVKVLTLVITLGLVLAGCGGGNKSYEMAADTAAMGKSAAYDAGGSYLSNDIYSYETEATVEMPEEAIAEESGSMSQTPEVQDVKRKLIRNVNLEVETETFDELLTAVEEKTERLSGYIEQSYTYNGSNFYGRGTRNANLTIRIPAANLNAFLSSIAEVSNVISRNDSVTDVTLQYVDMESHKEALVTEQTRLLELLEQAETVEDIITIEGRLSEVRYQIESMESQLRTMDNQVSYSTIYLYINEVEKLTPVEEQGTWEKISTGFVDSICEVGSGLADFFIGFIINLPHIILWGVILTAVILIIRAFWRGRDTRKQKRLEKQKVKAEKKLEKQKNKEVLRKDNNDDERTV